MRLELALLAFLAAPAFAAPAPAAGDRAWALVVAPGGREVVEPSLTIARPSFELRAGDALEYSIDARAIDAERAGLAIVFASGARELPPARPSDTGDTGDAGARTVRVELGAHAGDRVEEVELAARGLAPGPGLLRVRDARLVRKTGETLELAPPGASVVLARDPLAHACAVTIDASADDRPELWASAPVDSVRDPWLSLDLATLRAREARVEGSPLVELDARAPDGLVWTGDGVPLAFASAGEPRSVVARGQRLGLEPLDGGTTYELHLALAAPPGDARRTTWRLVGTGGEQRDVVVELPARDARGRFALEPEQGFLGAGFVVLDVPVASSFPLAAVELPRDAGAQVELLAASVEWRKDAAEDARFRRAWMTRERPSEGLARYLRNLRSAASPAGEDEHERRMFRALVGGDTVAFDALLVERVAAVRASAKESRDARITLYGVAAPYDPAIDDDAARAAAIERERDRCEVLTRFANLRTTAPDARTMRRLERAAPDVARKLGELARAGRVELGPAAWTHGEWGALGEEALARELEWGMETVQATLGADARIGWMPADIVWFRQLPQLAGALRLDALAGAPIDWSTSPRPLVFELRAPDNTAIACFAPPIVDNEPRDLLALEPLRDLAELVKRRNGAAELCVPLVIAGTSDAVQRENRKRARELVLADVGPRARQTTLGELVAGLRADPAFTAPAWRSRKEGAAAPELHARSDALRAWIRRAEAALVDAQVATALAAADGLVPLREREHELWERVLDAHEAATRPGAHPEHLASARDVVATAETLGEEALRVIARSADTSGNGRALFVFNPLAWERTATIAVDAGALAVLDAKGRAVAVQTTDDGARAFEAELPSLGYAVYRLAGERADVAGASPLVADGWKLSNAACALELDPTTGEIASLRRAGTGELLARATRLERVASDGRVDAGELVRVELVERGPVRASVRVVRRFGTVEVEQRLSLAAHAERVDVVTRVPESFDGSLRAVLDVRDPRDAAPRHVPFGYGALPEREELGHSAFATWVSQGTDRGVMLASVDAAACSSAKGDLALWLRDPEPDAARARTVRWAIVPLEGPEFEANAMQRAFEAVHAPRAILADAHTGFRPARHAFVEITRTSSEGHLLHGPDAGIVVTGLSSAEEGAGFVLRLFETSGRGGDLTVELDRPQFDMRRVDLLGRTSGDVKSDPKRARFHVDPWRIETLRWSWKP